MHKAGGHPGWPQVDKACRRLDDVLDYHEPLVRVPAPSMIAAPPTEPPVTPKQQQAAAAATEEDEGNGNTSVEDWIKALTQIQQEVQDAQQRAALEAVLRLRLQQEAQEKQDAVKRALYLRSMMEQYAKEEEERREQQQALRLLQILGLYPS